MIAKGSGAARGYAQGDIGAGRHRLVLRLAGKVNRQINRQRSHRTGDRTISVGNDDEVIVRVVRPGRIENIIGIGRVQDGPGAVPPLVVQRCRARGGYAQSGGCARLDTLVQRLNRNRRRKGQGDCRYAAGDRAERVGNNHRVIARIVRGQIVNRDCRIRGGRHLADAVVVQVGNEQIAGGTHHHPVRIIQAGIGGRPSVPGVTSYKTILVGAAIAGQRCDEAGGVHLADEAVLRVGNQQIAHGVHRHTGRIIEAGIGGGPSVPGISGRTIAGHRRDDAVDIHLAYDAVATVRNEQVAQGVHRHAVGLIQPGIGGRPAVPGVTGCAIAGHRRDDAVGVHLADDAATTVHNEHIAGGVQR